MAVQIVAYNADELRLHIDIRNKNPKTKQQSIGERT